MNALETWQVYKDGGVEGPFTREQLRLKVIAGRLSPEDKLLSCKTREATHVVDMFPESAEIARRATSDRIRRHTGSSGRMATASAHVGNVDAGITALAVNVATDPAVATPLEPITGWHGRRRIWGRHSGGSLARGGLALVLAVIVVVGLAWMFDSLISGMSPHDLPTPAATTLEGSWVADQSALDAQLGGQPAGTNPMVEAARHAAAGLTLTMKAGQGTFTSNQGTVSGAVTITAHPGMLLVTWPGSNHREAFRIMGDQVTWESMLTAVPLRRAP
jgi:hypothetical protein